MEEIGGPRSLQDGGFGAGKVGAAKVGAGRVGKYDRDGS